MSDFYDYIQPEPNRKRRRDVALPIVIAVAAIAVACFVGAIAWRGWCQMRFRGFVADLSESTLFSYEEEGITVTDEGETYTMEGDGVYCLYRMCWSGGVGKIKFRPKDEASVTITYADGSMAEVWTTTVQKNGDPPHEGAIVSYVNANGRRYTYLSESFSLSRLHISLENARSSAEEDAG